MEGHRRRGIEEKTKGRGRERDQKFSFNPPFPPPLLPTLTRKREGEKTNFCFPVVASPTTTQTGRGL